MRKTLTTVALLLALSCTSFGGEMSTPPAPAPSGGEMQNGQPTLNGYMPNGVANGLTQTALDLLTLLPSLL